MKGEKFSSIVQLSTSDTRYWLTKSLTERILMKFKQEQEVEIRTEHENVILYNLNSYFIYRPTDLWIRVTGEANKEPLVSITNADGYVYIGQPETTVSQRKRKRPET